MPSCVRASRRPVCRAYLLGRLRKMHPFILGMPRAPPIMPDNMVPKDRSHRELLDCPSDMISYYERDPLGGTMSFSPARVSLVVPTVNRTAELTKLMEALLCQEFKDFEILIVDQNCDDKIVPVLNDYLSQLNIRRIWTPTRRGISSAKNDGWRNASGDCIVFADDDCWYPFWFLRKGVELLAATGADLVSGRFADDSGRSINGRYASRAQFITRQSVWITQSEAASFYRRELLERLGGFDEELGIGSFSPWQAAEGPDFVLKALEQARLCYFDPSLYGFHREFDLDEPAMPRKGRIYGRGMGYVLRRHEYGTPTLIYWVMRPLFSAFLAAIGGRIYRVRYSFSVFLGRLEGMTGRVWAVGRRLDTADRSGDVHLCSNLDLSAE